MSLYPPPTSTVSVFNPALFQDFNVGGSYGTIGTSGSLAFPVAQGAETWTNGTSSATLDSGDITLSTIVGLVQTGVELNYNGIAYDNGTSISGATWENLVTKVQAIGAITATSTPVSPPAQSTTLNINTTLQIQDGETATLPHAFISLSADGGDLRMNLSPSGVTDDYGTAGLVLTSGGSAGSLSWGSGGGASVGTLNDVLNVGRTTTNKAIFTFTPTGAVTEIAGNGTVTTSSLGYSSLTNQLYLTDDFVSPTVKTTLTKTKLTIEDLTTDDLSEIKENYIQTVNVANNHNIALDNSNALPQITMSDGTSIVGMKLISGGGLELNTDGILKLEGLSGVDGQFLRLDAPSGEAYWDDLPIPASLKGETGVLSATTGSVTFSPAFATSPNIQLTLNTNGTSVIIPVAVQSIQSSGFGYTGFTWVAASTSATATILWYATE